MLWVRNSEIQDFLKNRAGWYYRWVEGLVPKKPQKALFIGTLVHKWIEVYYANLGHYQKLKLANDAMVKMIQETNSSAIDELEYRDTVTLAQNVVSNYYNEYKASDIVGKWDVIATELSFAIPLDDEIGFTGTIDLIVQDKQDGKIWFVDHKTTSSIEKYDRISDIDTQITKYWWALQQLAKGNGYVLEEHAYAEFGSDNEIVEKEWVPVAKCHKLELDEPFGFIYNIILKDYPVPPKVLKDGSLSKAKNQKTTAELYMQALQERGLLQYETCDDGFKTAYPVDEYTDIVEYLLDNPKEYFKRVRVFRNHVEIDNTMNEFYNICKEIKKVREGESSVYRTINFDTIHDPYLPLYQAEIDGSDVEYLKETLYTKEDVNNGINL